MSKFEMRNDAVEGKIFYDNKLATGVENTKKYFPPYPGEKGYNLRPKISVPIVGSIVDRVVNILNSRLSITVDNQEYQDIIDTHIKELKLYETIRDIFVNTITTGNNLFITRLGYGVPTIENWSGEWITLERDGSFGFKGYEYTITENNTIAPVLDSGVKKEDIYTFYVNDWIVDNSEHFLGFDPSIMTINIDKYDSGHYGKSFIKRFDTLVIEYNQVLSQAHYSSKVLQNVWATDRDVDNPEKPLIISPGVINFLGMNGTLQQIKRELNIGPEMTLLDRHEHHISRASQVPGELSGLRDAGKLPSGIALSILLQPLVELISRFDMIYKPMVKDVVTKLLYMQLTMNKMNEDNTLLPVSLPEVEIVVSTNNEIIPTQKVNNIDQIITLVEKGFLTQEEGNEMIKVFLPGQ